MPKDNKKKRQPAKQQQAGLGSANTFFETAEELANQHPESKERNRHQKQQKQQYQQNTPNPEDPQQ